jgi:uncharacterized protein YyaL (SSP411 family)
MAVIALLRMHGYTDEPSYREKAEQTLELLAGAAGQYGLFAATYGIAAVYFSTPPAQVVVVGEGRAADALYSEAIANCGFTTSVLKLNFSQAVAQNLPPTLAATIPQLPDIKRGETVAVICSGASCQPPVHKLEELKRVLSSRGLAA